MKTSVNLVKAAGFTIVELAIRARDNSHLNFIYSNLRQIEIAKAQWAVDNHKNTEDAVGI